MDKGKGYSAVPAAGLSGSGAGGHGADAASTALDEINALTDNGQVALAARKSFETALSSFLRKFEKSVSPFDTYREFIAKELSGFTTVDASFLVMDAQEALRFIGILTWSSSAGKDEFNAIVAISKLYFEAYEPVTFGDGSGPDPSRLRELVGDAYRLCIRKE